LFVKKVRICSLQHLIFQRLLDLNYSPLSALNEANLTSATQTLNFNPIMHYQAKNIYIYMQCTLEEEELEEGESTLHS
jgi:hypothetical protein